MEQSQTLPPVDFGARLQDQLSQVSAANAAHISFLGDVSSFYRDVANVEKEYAAKMHQIVKKAHERRTKRVREMIAGDNPISEPAEDAFREHTVDSAWSRILSEIEEDAQDRANFAGSTQVEVSDALKSAEKKFEEFRKKVITVSTKVMNDRDKIYGERTKAKSKYDDACEQLESHRSKREAAKDVKHAERASRHFEEGSVEMHDAKNNYILATAIANTSKSKYYHQDQVSLQKIQQNTWTLIVGRLSALLSTFSSLNASNIERMQRHNANIQTAISKIDVNKDQEVFANLNKRRFFEPPDFVFEPSPIWHDDNSLITDTEARVFLQNKLSIAKSRLRELEPLVDQKRKEIESIDKIREAYTTDPKLGDANEILDQLLDSVKDAIVLESESTNLETEVQIFLPAMGGDDGNENPHSFKPTSFTIPTTCFVCNSSIWGLSKQGLKCENCTMTIHAKCQMRAPPNCVLLNQHTSTKSKRTPSIISRTLSHRHHHHSNSVSATASTSTQSLQTTRSSDDQQQPTTPTSPLKSSITPPNANTATAASTSMNTNANLPSRTLPPQLTKVAEKEDISESNGGQALYDYKATNDTELSMEESEQVTILEDDADGSGWIKIKNRSGKEGYVPASYVHIGRASSDDIKESNIVKALYDYKGGSAPELEFQVGDRFELCGRGRDYGEGWIEVKRGQEVGIVPANFVESI